jgi:hypothetical protein
MPRRMFSSQIVDSDAFLDMPSSAQALYFHLGMRADDDGFVGNPRKILKMVGGNDDDLRLLVAKRFLLSFESGVVVIKHWLIHNLIRGDRYHETQYLEEKKTLTIKENKSYTEIDKPSVIPNDNQLATEVRLGKVRLGKVNKEREIVVSSETPSQIFKSFLKEPEEIISFLVSKGLDREMVEREIKKFISYWTEPNKSGTKQRWELEKTFELKRRLNTWFGNSQKYNKINNNRIVKI